VPTPYEWRMPLHIIADPSFLWLFVYPFPGSVTRNGIDFWRNKLITNKLSINSVIASRDL
jgi:hypothetical protein